MARRLVQMRLPPELVDSVDGLGRELGLSRTGVVELALGRLLGESAGGELGEGEAEGDEAGPGPGQAGLFERTDRVAAFRRATAAS